MRHPTHYSTATWIRLVRVHQKMERGLGACLRCHEVSGAQFDVLAQVGAAEGITQQELADKLLVTKGNICQLLDRLAANGLLARRPDGRANRLYLTEAGRRLYGDLVPAHEREIEALFAPLSEPEQRELTALLRKLDHALP